MLPMSVRSPARAEQDLGVIRLLDEENELQVVLGLGGVKERAVVHAVDAESFRRIDLHQGNEKDHLGRRGAAGIESRVLSIEERAIELPPRVQAAQKSLHALFAARERPPLDVGNAITVGEELAVREALLAPGRGLHRTENVEHGIRSPGLVRLASAQPARFEKHCGAMLV
jgi:hypothetical protein